MQCEPARYEARAFGAGAGALPSDLQPSVYSPLTLMLVVIAAGSWLPLASVAAAAVAAAALRLGLRRPERRASPAPTRAMALAAATAAASRVRGGSVAKVARRVTTPQRESPLGGVPLNGGGGLPMLRRRDGAGRAASTKVEVGVAELATACAGMAGRPTRPVPMTRPDAQPLAAATDCSWREAGRTREISSVLRLSLHAPPRFVTSRY